MEDTRNAIQQRMTQMATKQLRKDFSVTKANIVDDEQHIIKVRFAVFGNKDDAGDILVRGCFAKSIADRGPDSKTNRKIAFLWQHDAHDPIGKVIDIEEKEDGAYATIQLSNFDAVPNAKRTWVQLVDGDINQFSFGFHYIWDKVDYDADNEAYIVKEVALHEISVVTFGCNPDTEFVGIVKELEYYMSSASKEQKQNIKERLLTIISGAEPAQPLTSSHESMFARIGKQLN